MKKNAKNVNGGIYIVEKVEATTLINVRDVGTVGVSENDWCIFDGPDVVRVMNDSEFNNIFYFDEE